MSFQLYWVGKVRRFHSMARNTWLRSFYSRGYGVLRLPWTQGSTLMLHTWLVCNYPEKGVECFLIPVHQRDWYGEKILITDPLFRSLHVCNRRSDFVQKPDFYLSEELYHFTFLLMQQGFFFMQLDEHCSHLIDLYFHLNWLFFPPSIGASATKTWSLGQIAASKVGKDNS